MERFSQLPLELLPSILDHFLRPSQIASVCLVNSSFYAFAVQDLYRRAFIYAWHKDGKTKVKQLFTTLGNCPHLAKYVHQLTIRDYPKPFSWAEREDIRALCLQGIRNCVNLRSCTWTRDGSLSNDIISSLQDAPHLTELEINGHSGRWLFNAALLPGFKHLRKISLIMPDAHVLGVLPHWARETAGTLQHLTLICKSATQVTDELLTGLSQHLVNLEHFYLVGCPKVTHLGVWSIIANAHAGLRGLGLEGVSSTFDIDRLSELCADSQALRRLRSVTLTVETRQAKSEHSWAQAVVKLLAASPLEFFHISSLGGELHAGGLDAQFCADIVSAHAARLRRFSVHRLRMRRASVRDICARCPRLEQLFVVLDRSDLDDLAACLALAPRLRAVHVSRPMGPDADADDVPVVPREQVLELVRRCRHPALCQIGFNTRVHQIIRTLKTNSDGEVELELELGPYESPEVPEQFLVVRT